MKTLELHLCFLWFMWFCCVLEAGGWFAAECGQVVSGQDEGKPLSQLRELLPQANRFKYRRVMFTSNEKVKPEPDKHFGEASAVLQVLHHLGEEGAEPESKAFVYQSPTFQP